MAVNICRHGLEIDGQICPLYSGSVHYWRIERDRWPMVLDRIIEMGFRIICTDIPWSVHELERGVFDFGNIDPRKNVGEFLDMCAEKGLLALVRPGPHINAGITGFGFPDRIFSMDHLLARTSGGTPAFVPAPPKFFPAPCYASDDFFKEVELYFDALCTTLRERIYPAGPIVGVQPDNEMSFFFRTSPFDMDYSEPSMGLYKKYLRGKHQSIDNLNRLYGERYSDFDDVKPPREFEAVAAGELPYYFDWAEFKELYVFYGIHRTARMLRERGMSNVVYFHNYPTAYPVSPYHIPKMESQIDAAGVALYRGRKDYESIKLACRFLAGSSRLSFVPEFGSGAWPWWNPLFLKDQQFAVRAALMNGMKAANFHMIVDRERWYGAPVTRDARKRDGYFESFCDLNKFLLESEFHKYSMRSDVLLLSVADYERMEQMQSLLGPVPNLEPFAGMPPEWFVPRTNLTGLRDAVGADYRKQWKAFWRGFTEAGYTVTVADSSVEQAILDRFPVVIVPSFEFMNMKLQRRLLRYALMGGTLVVGPRMPLFNERMGRETKFSPHMLKPNAHRDSMTVDGLVVESADLFQAEHPLLERAAQNVCAYWKNIEKGKIVHLGFVFQDYTGIERSPGIAGIMRKIGALAGIEPLYASEDPIVETVAHDDGKHRLVFAANPTADARHTRIQLSSGEELIDIDSEDRYVGRTPELEVPAYTVRIFAVQKTV